MINRVLTTRFGRTFTLSLRLSQLQLTNLFFVLFFEQPRLPHAERQHRGNHLKNPQFSSTLFVYDPNKSTLTSSNDPNKPNLTSSRVYPNQVLQTFSSTTSTARGKKEETGIGAEVGEEVE